MDERSEIDGGRAACRRVILLAGGLFIGVVAADVMSRVARSGARLARAADAVSTAGNSSGVQLDPNVAPWWELTELPRVGESLAREVVAHRSAAAAGGAARAFPTADSLLEVRGIGPATLDRLRPFLRFDDPVAPASSRPSS